MTTSRNIIFNLTLCRTYVEHLKYVNNKTKNLLEYLKAYYSKMIFPTFDEIRINLNIKSKSGVHKLLKSLEEKNYIKRLPHKARALKINNMDQKSETPSSEVTLPFLGRIAAGNPIEAISNSFEQISVPNYLIDNKDQHFTLEVCGDSMIDEGIRDGDIVVIKKIETANTGDIVVALIDENEVTLKKFRSFKKFDCT